ncbi:hypothetical protein [Acidithiobacillus sp.]|uniref:hypothetical protein n=1 Tax=Acidithiobacillus sp. TaxID=1872118 RepID=UPI002619C3E7|nr:hypothetical protein [Acidithiobacillus sp.]
MIGTVIVPMPVFLPPIFPVLLVIPISALIPVPVVVLPWAIVSLMLRIVMIGITPVVSKSILGNGKRQPENNQWHYSQFFSHMIPPIPKYMSTIFDSHHGCIDTGPLQSVIFTVMPSVAPSSIIAPIIASIRGGYYAPGKHGRAKKNKKPHINQSPCLPQLVHDFLSKKVCSTNP